MKTFKKIVLWLFVISSSVLLILVFIGAYFTDNKMKEELDVVNNALQYLVFGWIGITLVFIVSLSPHNKTTV